MYPNILQYICELLVDLEAWACFVREFVVPMEGQVVCPDYSERLHEFSERIFLLRSHRILWSFPVKLYTTDVAHPNRVFVHPFAVSPGSNDWSTCLKTTIQTDNVMVSDI